MIGCFSLATDHPRPQRSLHRLNMAINNSGLRSDHSLCRPPACWYGSFRTRLVSRLSPYLFLASVCISPQRGVIQRTLVGSRRYAVDVVPAVDWTRFSQHSKDRRGEMKGVTPRLKNYCTVIKRQTVPPDSRNSEDFQILPMALLGSIILEKQSLTPLLSTALRYLLPQRPSSSCSQSYRDYLYIDSVFPLSMISSCPNPSVPPRTNSEVPPSPSRRS